MADTHPEFTQGTNFDLAGIFADVGIGYDVVAEALQGLGLDRMTTVDLLADIAEKAASEAQRWIEMLADLDARIGPDGTDNAKRREYLEANRDIQITTVCVMSVLGNFVLQGSVYLDEPTS